MISGEVRSTEDIAASEGAITVLAVLVVYGYCCYRYGRWVGKRD